MHLGERYDSRGKEEIESNAEIEKRETWNSNGTRLKAYEMNC